MEMVLIVCTTVVMVIFQIRNEFAIQDLRIKQIEDDTKLIEMLKDLSKTAYESDMQLVKLIRKLQP